MRSTETSRRVRLVLSALLIAAQGAACFTGGVVRLSGAEHVHLQSIASVAKASLRAESLFVTLDLQSAHRSSISTYLLEIPLTFPMALPDESAPHPFSANGNLLQHAGKGLLRPISDLPADASEIPVIPVTLEDLGGLEAIANGRGPGVHVFSITYTPDPLVRRKQELSSGQQLPAGPFLGVVKVASSGSTESLLVGDVHKKTTKHKAWLLLTPLTVAGDLVTFPIQLILALVLIHC